MQTLSKAALILFTLSMLGCEQTVSNDVEEQSQALQAPIERTTQTSSTAQVTNEKMTSTEMITVTGRIEYKTFEGGFFALIADDGRQFTPHGLPPEYRKHGMRLTVKATPKPDMMTTTQFGVVLQIESIVTSDDSAVTVSPTNPTDI